MGYAPGQAKPHWAVNHRNGKSAKRVLTDTGALAIEVPRDRHGLFEPQLIGKHQRRFTGFDDKIIAMYARGMTVREIQGFLAKFWMKAFNHPKTRGCARSSRRAGTSPATMRPPS